MHVYTNSVAMIRNAASFVLFAWLCSSCGGGGSNTNAGSIRLDDGGVVRQIYALSGNQLKVDIFVNSGPQQSFIVEDPDETITADITGVRSGELNDIVVVWSEMLNGYQVNLSRQEQEFQADEDTTINATHNFTEYDNDQDGVNNYDEREAGTCVWSAEPCELDIPTNNSLIVNGDFSRGEENWWHLGIDPSYSDGEACMSSWLGAEEIFNAALGYRQNIPLEAGFRYTVYADVRSQPDSSVFVALETPDFAGIKRQEYSVSSVYRQVVMQYDALSDFDGRFAIQFGRPSEVRYCFDNIIMTKTPL